MPVFDSFAELLQTTAQTSSPFRAMEIELVHQIVYDDPPYEILYQGSWWFVLWVSSGSLHVANALSARLRCQDTVVLGKLIHWLAFFSSPEIGRPHLTTQNQFFTADSPQHVFSIGRAGAVARLLTAPRRANSHSPLRYTRCKKSRSSVGFGTA
jgi:hypothetical protein